MAASRHKLSIGTSSSSVEPFVRLQVGLDGNEVTIKNTTTVAFKSGHSGINTLIHPDCPSHGSFATRTIWCYALTSESLEN